MDVQCPHVTRLLLCLLVALTCEKSLEGHTQLCKVFDGRPEGSQDLTVFDGNLNEALQALGGLAKGAAMALRLETPAVGANHIFFAKLLCLPNYSVCQAKLTSSMVFV